MTDNSFQNINKNYYKLTRKQKKVLDLLLSNPEDACYISLKNLSKRSNVSEVTILRMCKRLGFENFIQLKKAFRTHTERLVKNFMETSFYSLELSAAERRNKEMIMKQILQNARTQSNKFYSTIKTKNILKTARLILKAKTVLICGQGASVLIAEYFYRRISPLIPNAVLVHPEDMDNVQASLIKLHPGDHIIAISFPRYYTAMQNIVQYAEYRGANVTTITDNLESPVVTPKSINYLCNTSTKIFYNSYSLPVEIVNLVASAIVLEMGESYDKLISDAHDVIHFINKSDSE